MTFKEIWEESKDKIVINKNPEPEVEDTPSDGELGSTPPEASKLRILKILSLLGVDSFEELAEREREMLEYISNEIPGDLGDEIVRMESRIGTPPIGMSRIRHIYNHLRFNNATKSGDSRQEQSDITRDPSEDSPRDVKIEIKLR